MSSIVPTGLTSGSVRREVRRATVLGMSQEARDAWSLLLRRLSEGPLTLLGAPGPNRALLDRARRAGALEGALHDDFATTRRVVIPMTGATPLQKQQWKERGHEVIDLTLPVIRRAQVTLNLLRTEGSRLVLVGHPGSPECLCIAGRSRGVAVIESVDEVTDLPFAPRSGVVFQTSVSSQRARLMVEALRGRHRDSRVQVLDTLSAAGLQREEALRNLAHDSDLLLIIADPDDASGMALYETARWLGRPAKRVSGIDELDPRDIAGIRRIGLSAGEYTPDDLIDDFAVTLNS